MSYDHREQIQPQLLNFGNVGPMWTFDWLSYVTEEPIVCPPLLGNCVPAHVNVFLRGSGQETYLNPDANGVYPTHWRSLATLVRTSTDPVRYERRLSDGTVEVFAFPDGAPAGQRRVFMTESVDPSGQRLEFTYDAQFRLVAVTDALGQVTTLTYGHPSDPLKITAVTDPFGRSAVLSYSAIGQLETITDVIGITSRFGYGNDDFISSLTTPYGTTTFRHEPAAGSHRLIEATDPLGGTEHLEFHFQSAAFAATQPAGAVPTGFEGYNEHLDYYNTVYWSKQAWMLGAGDVSQAVLTHWLLKPAPVAGYGSSVPVAHSRKPPLESRVWYAYPGQTNLRYVGIGTQPARTARVLDDGTSQISEASYNPQGQVTMRIDPLGRGTEYTYAANGIDLLEVRQTTGGMNDLLASYGNYTNHQPQSVTDAAGQTTTMTYNSAGQVLTVTNAKNETTTNTYEPSTGRLLSVTGPVSGATTSYTYDAYGRVRTVTDADNATVTMDYDLFDRPIRVTYPDGTYEETVYDRLDAVRRRDRLGRWSYTYYDPLRRVVGTRDPAGRTTQQVWCTCGSLEALVDAKGQQTSWERDVQGRVTREVRADGTTATLYTYETATSRLKTVTDPKQQVTTYTYAADDQLLSTVFRNATIATPSVSYTYDPQYGRAATMADGIGTTIYAYHPVGQPGAGQVASVDGPLANDVITYSYDQLGRATSRAIDGAANTVTWAFDALGRVTSEATLLGTFTYTYDGPTARVATVTYPNSQTSTYSYFSASQDHRLQTIHHKYPNGTTLAKFDYTYDVVGNILTWRQQADASPVLWTYGYDAADQLVAAVKESTDPTPVVLKRYAYAYDPAGNRTTEQIDDQVTGASYDALNRLVSQQASGVMQFAGTVNEPAAVTVQGVPAVVAGDNTFRAGVPVATGTNTVTVAATDASGNVATQQYEVDSFGAGRTFTYDANGNLTADGTRTFEWDARNRLVAVNVGTLRSEFTYDGRQRRVRTIEKDDDVAQSDTRAIWCEIGICEERAADGTTVTRRAFTLGEQAAGVARFFAVDHLGSVGEVTNGSSALLARYAYDPWGRRSVTTGTDVTKVGYTGHAWHAPSKLHLSLFRSYDPAIGRWFSEDPSGLMDGPNRYAYVENAVIGFVDPLGLSSVAAGMYRFTSWMRDPQGKDIDWSSLAGCVVLCVPSTFLDDIIALGVGGAASGLPWQPCKVVGKFIVKRAVPALAVLNVPTYLTCTYICYRRSSCGNCPP